MTEARHLTEEERQGAADGTLAAARRGAVADHVAACERCAADVARLRALMARIHHAPVRVPGAELDAWWSAIRSRIERSKVVELPSPRGGQAARSVLRRRPRWLKVVAPAAAAVVLVAGALALRGREGGARDARAIPGDSAPFVTAVADSSRAYQEEATTLLNELEMQRSMLRPSTAASIDSDLRSIDASIREIRDALARDPNNPALRQLLVTSYRQKVELLQRARNAG